MTFLSKIQILQHYFLNAMLTSGLLSQKYNSDVRIVP